ncbi:MAG: diguanylate cyclase [Pseudomonadota bacterium]
MLRSHRPLIFFTSMAVLATMAVYATGGSAKPLAQWRWIDVAGEASIAVMACSWFLLVLSSRPPGRVTTLLATGLAGLMLGAVADCLDEFFSVPKGQHWNHIIESGITLAGMLSLTWGLLYWRQEQLIVTEHLQKRERVFRDHRSFDQLTQVADADYLRAQLSIEHARAEGESCLLMLDIDNFHLVNRDFGQREGDRVLQAVTQVLLLNLRNTDLLCRYAGDRFAVLLPSTQADAAYALAEHLRRAVASLRHHAQRSGQPIAPTIRTTFRTVDADPRQLLKELNRALERRMPYPAAGSEAPGGAPAHA